MVNEKNDHDNPRAAQRPARLNFALFEVFFCIFLSSNFLDDHYKRNTHHSDKHAGVVSRNL